MVFEKNQLFIAIAVCILLVLFLFILFLFQLHKYQRSILKAHSEKAKAEINMIERERMNIATELHNDLSPQLATLQMLFNQLQTEQNEIIIHRGNQIIAQSMDQIRKQIRTLSPISYFQLDFMDAIQYLAQQQTLAGSNLNIHISTAKHFDLKPEASNHLFRILQEIILNTFKHANARNLFIDFSTEKNSIIVRTADDGVGFKESIEHSRDGFGLFSIQSRIEALNGVIMKNPNNRSGTQYYLEFPISWEKQPVEHFSKS